MADRSVDSKEQKRSGKRVDVGTRIDVGTHYPRALIHLVDLLHDPEPHARSAAARAIACAELVLVELAVYRANHKLRHQLQAALDRRQDERLLSCFDEVWGTGPESNRE